MNRNNSHAPGLVFCKPSSIGKGQYYEYALNTIDNGTSLIKRDELKNILKDLCWYKSLEFTELLDTFQTFAYFPKTDKLIGFDDIRTDQELKELERKDMVATLKKECFKPKVKKGDKNQRFKDLGKKFFESLA